MRGEQLGRQWQLVQRLARSRYGVGVDELAEDLDCTKRTVYRDLDALMYAGFPVLSEKREGRTSYRFLESFGLGDVPFTPDEVLALAFSEDLLKALEGTVFHDSISSALAKIRASLGPELSSYLAHLAETFRVLPGPHKRYAEYRDTIQALSDASVARKGVRIRYRTGRTGEERWRQLDPYRLWYRSGGLYVIGHDHLSAEIRTFAVDRILAIETGADAFEIDPEFDFDAHQGSSFGVISEPAELVRVRFSPEWRTHVEEHVWHPSQQLQGTPEGGVLLEMEVGSTAELRNWILSFGPGAEVLEPTSLRDDVAKELAAAADLYR